MAHCEIICAGEYLIDLISTDYAATFREAHTYRRFPGGSPANLAMNLRLLGCRPALAATVGRDGAGAMLVEEVARRDVNTAGLRQIDLPTTAILVTRSRATSDFEPYRSADYHIAADQLPESALRHCRIFHTTAFALSREPARSTIMQGAAKVVAAGGRISIDANYAAKIWPDRHEALRVIDSYLALGATGRQGCLAKFSEVDFKRLFGRAVSDPEPAIAEIMNRGAGVVCLTMGPEGCYVNSGGETFHLPVRPVEVRDTTGAGDAFWSGFLAGHLRGLDWPDCARAGRAVAETKLSVVGPLRDPIDLLASLET